MYSIIFSIMNQYPEAEWLDRCHSALPDMDDGSIFSAFEILSGGDLHAISDGNS